MSNENTVMVKPLRKMLQVFNEDLGRHSNENDRHKLGRVLTIIDAAIGDPEQRKAIKDLVNNEWWGPNNRPSESPMVNPHTDLRAICQVLGFELYDQESIALPALSGNEEFARNRYTKVSKED